VWRHRLKPLYITADKVPQLLPGTNTAVYKPNKQLTKPVVSNTKAPVRDFLGARVLKEKGYHEQ
jgi:hypothetical protein